jgi:hypothetical protein
LLTRIGQDKARRIGELAYKFLNKQGGPPAHPVAIKELLCYPLTGGHSALELKAWERLLCGVEFAEEEFWVSELTSVGESAWSDMMLQKELLEDYSARMPLIIEEYHKDSVDCDMEEDLLTWMLKRQQVSELQMEPVKGTDCCKDSV